MTNDPAHSTPAVGSGRGRLRVYLGAAPGVGKTVAMLSEGRRRAERGTDVVVAVMEDHGRDFTAQAVGELPVLPRRRVEHRGVVVTEMDTAAVLARRPAVALVDELAHTNAVGSTNPKRWQDVQELLAAGIDVITTVNVQHLESLNDVVAAITGVRQQETVPDAVVRAAEQIELVDMTPQALRRRMAHGHVYPAERIDTALGNFFREGNLTALRELALLWVADRVEEGLERYRTDHGITGSWPARERIVVCMSGAPEDAALLRRGARVAGRVSGRSLVAVHVVRSDGTATGAGSATLEKLRLITESLGGTMHLVVGDDVAATVLDFARAVNGSRIVVGSSRHGRFTRLVRPSVAQAIVDGSGDIDVLVVTSRSAGSRPATVLRTARRGPQRWTSWLAAVLIPVLLALALLPLRGALNLTTVLLVFQLGVLGNALIGGVLPAAAAAVTAGVLANLLFVPPLGSLTIAQPENAFAIVVFVIVGVTVASVVDRSAQRAVEAARGRAEAQMIAAAATGIAEDADPVHAVLEQVRVAFGMRRARLLHGADDTVAAEGEVMAEVGAGDPDATDDVTIPVGRDGLELGLLGRTLPGSDRRLAEVFAAQAGLAAERQRLAAEAQATAKLRAADRVRTAVLAAVSHDLRTPLATVKASVSSLRDPSIDFDPADRSELLAAADEAADQLDRLLANLLDLSRLQTGVLVPVLRPRSVDEVVHPALLGLPPGTIEDRIPDDLPLVSTDAGLLERVIANLVGNAVRHRGDRPVRLLAGVVPGNGPGTLQIRIVDHGPGVPMDRRETMFAPFQRLGDAPDGAGLGLGLAVARGLAEAVGATIEVDDTPGGGLTMVVTVPLWDPDRTDRAAEVTG
ncbi:DUF4118 domain-containing protein [Nakamurella flava]|uniref:DUF4118 domain-containing protein n=1 Tax=Nakamurella flava TaxID=2576308 RepID=UPI00197C2DE1|nr:DUF4118 domain-containing protein [Nakamurella flava]